MPIWRLAVPGKMNGTIVYCVSLPCCERIQGKDTVREVFDQLIRLPKFAWHRPEAKLPVVRCRFVFGRNFLLCHN